MADTDTDTPTARNVWAFDGPPCIYCGSVETYRPRDGMGEPLDTNPAVYTCEGCSNLFAVPEPEVRRG